MSDNSAKHPVVTLSDEWQDWLVENLREGAPSEVLIQRLVASGAPVQLARTAVTAFQSADVLTYIKRREAKLERHSQILGLCRQHMNTHDGSITELSWSSAEDFYRECYALNRPVVYRGLLKQWGITHWNMQYLRTRFGHVSVTACTGRETTECPDKNFAKLTEEMRLQVLLDEVHQGMHENATQPTEPLLLAAAAKLLEALAGSEARLLYDV